MYIMSFCQHQTKQNTKWHGSNLLIGRGENETHSSLHVYCSFVYPISFTPVKNSALVMVRVSIKQLHCVELEGANRIGAGQHKLVGHSVTCCVIRHIYWSCQVICITCFHIVPQNTMVTDTTPQNTAINPQNTLIDLGSINSSEA